MRGIKYTAKEKKQALDMWLVDKKHYKYVCKKFKCTRVSLWRWKTLYDGTLECLENKSSVPLTPHPNAHTPEERATIEQAIADNPTMGYTELHGYLRINKSYTRSFGGMSDFIRKNCLMATEAIAAFTKYVPQEYDTPTMLGVKWQMDVKYVPTECLTGEARAEFEKHGTRFYQYTAIDEATRERFIFPYKSHTAESTKDFIKRAIAYFGYIPASIQTDNGKEFVNTKVDKALKRLSLIHLRIKPRTPRHNGKVERSHRNDNQRFYKHLRFSSYEELKAKMAAYLERSNNIPTSALKNRHGKQAWQTPLEKRAELLEVLAEQNKPDPLRLAKKLKRHDIQILTQAPPPQLKAA